MDDNRATPEERDALNLEKALQRAAADHGLPPGPGGNRAQRRKRLQLAKRAARQRRRAQRRDQR